MQHQIARSLIIVTLIFVSNLNSHAQEDAYWQGLSIKNPAVIGTPSDWVFGGYVFYNLKKNTSDSWSKPKAFVTGADYKIAPKLGTIGVNYSWEKSGGETVYLPEISYAYSFAFKKGTLNAGISFGLHSYKSELIGYHLDYGYGSYGGYGDYYESYYSYSYDDPFKDIEEQNLKTGAGLFYNSVKFDIGFSVVWYTKIKEQKNQYYAYEIKIPRSFNATATYRFILEKKLVIEPNLMVDFFDNGSANFYPGIFAKYNNLIWAGYSELNWGDLHSVMLGIDFLKRLRVGYGYDFSTKFGTKKVHLNEILLGIKLN